MWETCKGFAEKGGRQDQLILQSGKFTLAIAGDDQRQLAMQVGSLRGAKEDKFERFSIKAGLGNTGQALIPDGVAAWMECEVESTEEI